MTELDRQDIVFNTALSTLRIALTYVPTSTFLVYAHKNDRSQSNASQEIAANFIKWLNYVGSNSRSDRRPLGSDKGWFFRSSVDNESVHDILESQMCLLPSRLYKHSVEKVILCGSQLLEEYVKTPFYQSYQTKLEHVFSATGQQDVQKIIENLRQVVLASLNDRDFHHVLTEIALLEILRVPESESRSPTSKTPVVLNGDYNEVFPQAMFPPTTIRITLWTPDKRNQHDNFFKVLSRLFEPEEPLLEAMKDTYQKCIELASQDSDTMFEIHVLELFHRAYLNARRDDLKSLSFAEFLQQHQYSSEKIAKILQCVQSLLDHSVSENFLQERDLSNQKIKCHQALLPPGIVYSEQKNQNPKRIDGTCMWVLENPSYTNWRDTNEKKLLWISAGVGCGKSVLCRAILEDDLPKHAPGTRIIYFFFKDTIKDQRSARICLLALLHQLISQQHSLVQHALPMFRHRGERIAEASFSELWTIFMMMVKDRSAGDIICLLDGLDECNEEERQKLISSIQESCSAEEQSSSSNLRFLVTCRPYLDLEAALAGINNTGVVKKLDGMQESDQIKQEIDLVIKHRVHELAQRIWFPPEVRDYLQDTLLRMENRTYLWLRLVLDFLLKKWPMKVSDMKKTINALPRGINEAYECLLAKCDDPEYARNVLEIVLAAYRPLTVEEINVALSVSQGTKKYSHLNLADPSSLRRMLPGRCGLMISIIDSKVYFIHQTVKEFLLQKEVQRFDRGKPSIRNDEMVPEWSWKGSFSIEEAHQLMARLCMQVLLFTEFPDAFEIYQGLLSKFEHDQMEANFKHPSAFFSYAGFNWADHYRDGKIVLDIARSLVHTNPMVSNIYRGQGVNAVQLAAAGRHRQIFDLLIEHVSDVNEITEGIWTTVLIAAASGGDSAIVRSLLARGAMVNTQGGFYGNALQIASSRGHLEVVRLLLDNGAELNTQCGHFGNALQAASSGGRIEIVTLLLDKGAEVNTQAGHYGNALQAASYGDHLEVVRLLLDNGAEVNTQDGLFGSALQAASFRGHLEMVRLLLDNGAELNTQCEDFGNPLRAASSEGHLEVVRLLLDNGAELNTQCGHFGNALQAASSGGHLEVVRLLLDKKAEVNTRGGDFGNALQAASFRGHLEVVKLLLDKGAEVNIQGGRFGSALQAASLRGRQEVVRLLLDNGAENNQGGLFGNE